MVCPNCGSNIPDGNVYCEKCGEELFLIIEEADNPVVSDEIQTSISELSTNEFIDDGMEYDDEPNVFSLILSGRAGGKGFYIGLALVLVVVIIFSVMFFKNINSRNGLEYQLEQAEIQINNENYSAAIEHLEKAYKYDKDISHKFMIADCYNILERDMDALSTLLEIAYDKQIDESDRILAYQNAIAIYEGTKNYQKLNSLIEECDIASIQSDYSKYLVEIPMFSVNGGTYEEVISLKLASKLPNGTIHYTIGNTTPNENSEIFDAPIELSYGSYTINAIYVNDYGVSSEVVTQKYLIDVEFEFEPEILLESGDYTSSQMIKAKVPSMYTLYYTTDGTIPDRSSTRYTGPIPLPLGESHFIFIEYAADGTSSNIVERDYTLTFDTFINEENSLAYLNSVMVELGINLDGEGHRAGVSGTYMYVFTTAYTVENKKGDFFFMVEYYKDEYGNLRKTGEMYAIKYNDATRLYKVSITTGGGYKLTEFYKYNG